MTLDVTSTDSTLEILDPLERIVVTLASDDPIDPTPTDTGFVYPVDHAVAITANRLTVDRNGIVVLDETGETLDILPANATQTLPTGTYYLQVADDLKTYLRVHAASGIELEVGSEDAVIDFGAPTDLAVGARSIASQPDVTITTTTAPEDLAVALSALGSALKDDSPMRSFPSLRGHPPTIQLGDTLDIPDEATPPETGITILVPPSYDHLFPVASLAYYLGATVELGSRPRIETDTGFTHNLTTDEGFEEAVARTLKQVFTLDCFVRSEGPYGCELTNAADIAYETGFDPAELIDQPLTEQLEAYLSVPWEALQPFIPRWSSTAYVEYATENIPHLPFLVDDLAIVRTPSVAEHRTVSHAHATGDEFTRAATADSPGIYTLSRPAPFEDPQFRQMVDPADVDPQPSPDPTDTPTGTGHFGLTDEVDEPATRTDVDSATDVDPSADTSITPDDSPVSDGPWMPSFEADDPDARSADETTAVVPEYRNTQQTLWLADGIPVGATKPTIDAYHHGLSRDPVDEIEVLVVCNDARMAAEDVAVRRLLSADTSFDVTVRPFRGLLTHELEELLRRGADFLHYVGHIDDQGFVCQDGHLDAAGLDDVNVDACFLNACQSYEQGRALVDAGAIASIVTLTNVLNSDAVTVGSTVAQLLNAGFPLAAALDIATDEHPIDDYTLIGDGSIQITENPQGAVLLEAETTSDGTFVSQRSYLCPQGGLGSMYSPIIDGLDDWYLTGTDATGLVTSDVLTEYLAENDHPVRLDGEFGWSTDWQA